MLGVAVVGMLSLGLGYALFEALEDAGSDDDEEPMDPVPIGPIPDPDPVDPEPVEPDPDEPGGEEPAPEVPGEEPPEGEPGGAILVEDGDKVVGTDEDDVFNQAPGAGTRVEDVVVDGQAGNDTFNLTPQAGTILGGDGDDIVNVGTGHVYLKIEGGAGADRITIVGSGEDVGVYGGDGNDTIVSDSYLAVLYGGAGDDTFVDSGVDDAWLYGDDGNDTMVLTGSAGLAAYGGEGNDLIDAGTVSNQFDTQTGAFGGSGDDTLRADAYLGRTDVPGELFFTSALRGGEGADSFEVRVDTATFPLDGETGDDPEGVIQRIDDFAPGEDVLVIDVTRGDLTFRGLEIVEAPDGSHTDVVLTYDTAVPGVTQQGVIRLEGTNGVTAADVVLAEVEDADPAGRLA